MDIRYNCAVARQHSMSVPRYSAGVLALDGKGYAFGGYCAREALVTCEQFTLSREWDILSCMQYPRHSFSPVPYKKKVYLPDISKVHGFMEIFTPAKNKFRLASIRLPTNSSNSCAFIVADRLCVLSCDRFLWYWKVGTSESGRKEVKLEKSALSSCPVGVRGNKVYWTEFHTGELVQMDLNQLSGRSVS